MAEGEEAEIFCRIKNKIPTVAAPQMAEKIFRRKANSNHGKRYENNFAKIKYVGNPVGWAMPQV